MRCGRPRRQPVPGVQDKDLGFNIVLSLPWFSEAEQRYRSGGTVVSRAEWQARLRSP
jgi:hypothetical protein